MLVAARYCVSVFNLMAEIRTNRVERCIKNLNGAVTIQFFLGALLGRTSREELQNSLIVSTQIVAFRGEG